MTEKQAMGVASTFDKIVSEMIRNPQTTVAEINYFSDRNMEQVLAWNSNEKANIKTCIHHEIEQQARARPNAEAVCAWDGSLSYKELSSLSNRLAAHLVALGVGPEVFVPLCFDKSKWTIVAVLAVLKAGGIFVPLDPTHPVPRLQALAHKVEAWVVLCSRQHLSLLATVADKLIPLDRQAIDELDTGEDVQISRGSPSNGAYMIFTSGTTGEPKGALIEHGSLVSSAKAHGPAMMMDTETRSLQFAASTFDVSITEILTCLILGGCVCVPSEEARLNDIAGAINTLRVNWALLTPTFVSFINPATVPGMKTLVTGGEAMTAAIIRAWGHINLINCYGPAETAVVSHVHRGMREGVNPLNIGNQVGIHCWIVDRYNHDRLMPVGAVGELLIESHTMAREYFKEEAKTAEAFIYDPLWTINQEPTGSKRRMYKTGDLVRYNADGTFHIAGRKDTQVKYHGQRIELGEIEHHLNRDQNIRHGMVLLPKAGYCQGRLLTIVQLCDALGHDLVHNGRPYELVQGNLSETVEAKVADTKQFLSDRLPAYMVPSMWVVVEFIPRLQSGKLDRKQTAKWIEDMSEDIYRRLNPITTVDSSEGLSSATETELEIRSIWCHILNRKLDQVGLKQSFLSLGGDSISAMQVMGECRKKGLGLTVKSIIGCKSVSDLALQVKAIDTPLYHEEIIDQPFDLSPIQHLYFSRPGHSEGHYNQSFLLRVSRTIVASEMIKAIEIVIKRHSMLRARFAQNATTGDWQQRVTNEVLSSYRLRTLKLESRDHVDAELTNSQTCLNPVQGPMFAADIIDVNDAEQLLFVVAHHLVIDLVSWRVILQDLEELLQNPEAANSPEKPLPYQTWCKLQEKHCRELTPRQVLPVENVPSGNAEYWGMADRTNIYGEMKSDGFEIDSALTSLLVKDCHQALRTEIPDILIAAMIHSFGEAFTDRPVPPVFAEGHGRESWDASIDLSRIVGWFTTIYPVFVENAASNDLIKTVKLVKDLRRRVPDKGRPYWASRWLTEQGKEAFGHHWPLEVTFNYLGQYQQLEREGALFTPAKDIAGETRGAADGTDVGPKTPTISFFEVSAVIMKGALRFSFAYNQHMKHQDTIGRWISGCQETLRTVVHDLARMSYEPTLSDYPLLALDYDGLNTMTAERLPQVGVSSLELVEDIYPCSPMQQGLLVSTTKNTAFYAAYTLHEVKTRDHSRVDSNRLAMAWSKIVERHPILRTIFIDSASQRDALYDQVVLKKADTELVHSQCGSDAEAIDSLSQDPLKEEDSTQQLHRFSICTSSTGKVYCRLDISHIIMDGTSLSIVFRDLALAYEGKLNEGVGPLYSNYISHLQSQPIEAGIEYWKTYLANVEPCHFPVLDDGNAVAKQLRYVRVNFEELTDLQKLCDEQGVTISNAIYAAWALTLHCYTGLDEVCFGYLTSARDSPIEGIQDVVGPVINMLTCRANMSATTNLKKIMAQVQLDYLDSLAYRHIPLAEVQHALHLSSTALFNTAMSYRKLPPKAAETPMVSFVECRPTYDPDEFNVSINIEAGEKDMAIDLMYWTDCLSDDQASNVASTFTKSLSNILHHSDKELARLDHLSERNRQQITRWNKRMPNVVEDSLHNIIKQQTLRRPQAPAIASWDGDFTYAKLDENSTRLAHYLRSLGVGPEVFVLTCFEKSAFTIIAMIAILKAGGACVPLDPTHPKDALKLRANDTKAPIILTSSSLADSLKDLVPQLVAVNTEMLQELPAAAEENLPAVQPNNACVIIYTSGSTGKPKGVVLEHRGIATSAKYHGPLLGYEENSRVLQFASYTFDNSLAEIFTTLMHGGCVCVPSDHERLNDLAGVINRHRVTFIDITPTVATFLNPSEVPTLKRIALGGEAVTKRVVEIWRDAVSLHCCYGPSECSINATYSGDIASPGKATNIGRAIGSVAWVVDPSNFNRLLPVGCVGELLIDGPIVSRGYLNNAEKTAESFVTEAAWLSQISEDDVSQRRIYKTGDLVRYDSDGTLMYLGRKDTQVKLNGQRIELGEIEYHVEQNTPANAQSAVELVSFNGRKALACFICLESDGAVPNDSEENSVLPMSETFRAIAKGLEVTLGGKIPAYMVPTVWLPLSRMPLTSSGKLNRRSLRMTAQTVSNDRLVTYKLASKSGRAPSSDMEKTLANMWGQILGIEPASVGVEDNFFKLGGDSIGAMRLVSAARSMDFSLTIAIIFQKPTLFDMARAATQTSKVTQMPCEPFSLVKKAESINRVVQEMAIQLRVNPQSIKDIYPCTTIQEGLMTLSIKEPGAYVAQMVYRLPSGTNLDKFRQAWSMVIQTEPVLRTRVVYTEHRGFLQVVVNEPLVWSTVADLSGLPDDQRRLPAYNGGELSKYTIVGEDTSAPHFVWTIHHALYDGWCLPLILDKVKACYNSLPLIKLTQGPSYASFVRHLTEIDPTEADDFWSSRLSDISTQQFPRLPNPAYQASASGMLTRIAPFSRQTDSAITMATMIRAAWALVVAAHSGSNDVVFWETVTGRDAPVPGIEDMMGPTLATVPNRISIDPKTQVHQFLDLVQAQSAEAMSYQYSGIQHIKRLSPDAAIACEAQNLIAINRGRKETSDGFWDMQNNEMAGTNFYTYPLMLSCHIGDDDIEIDAHYDEDVLPTWQMERILDYFAHVLDQFSSKVSSYEVLGEMSVLSPNDQRTLQSWNGKPVNVVDRCVHHMVGDQVQKQKATKHAICSWDGSFTYRELDELSTRLAHFLSWNGVGSTSIVPLCFEKSAWTIVAMIAVLKAGASFVPLDPAHPETRLLGIIADVEADILLCSPKYQDLCNRLVSHAVAVDRPMIDRISIGQALQVDCATSSAAYIIFTSGTTGKPKGTIVEHAAFCTSAIAHGTIMQMQQSSRVLQFASYTFDASIMEILTTLIMGGTVCVPSDEARLNNVTSVINEMDVNWALLTPSFVQLIQPSSIPRFETLVLGGEAMSLSHISTWSNSVHLMNAYGPSETAVVAAVNPKVSLKTGPANIGHAVGGRCWITDADNHDRLVPVGAVGELVVEGPILARGYLKNPSKTAEVFITNPKWAEQFSAPGDAQNRRMYKTGDLVKYAPDGTLIFQGRKDNQVKIHGQRLELSEVEHHLGADPVTQHALAIIPASGPCKKKLVAVISLNALANMKSELDGLSLVGSEAAASNLSGIRERIGTHVPPYMVPSKWVVLRELPLLPSGKLDRRQVSTWVESMSDAVYQQISEVETSMESLDREASPVELQIRAIWARILNLPAEKISFTQSFLHLGGDSISAMQVMASCRSENLAVTVPQIMQSKSIAELASHVTLVEEIVYEAEEIEKTFELSPIQRMYLDTVGDDWAQFNQSVLLRLRRRLEVDDLAEAVEAVVNSHSMLRARFAKSDSGVWQQRISQDVAGSYRIRTHEGPTTDEQLSGLVEESQKYLNIEKGPLFAVDLIEMPGQTGQIVSFVAHHLVIDVVSWHIIMQDIEDYYESCTLKAPVSLPFQTWCSLQADHAKKDTARNVFYDGEAPVPDFAYWGMDKHANIHGDAVSESFELDTKTTLLLLGPCHEALRTEPVDVFIGSLLESFRQVFNDRVTAPAVFNEGHGREPWDHKLDLSRTVGWFTTMCPIFLPEMPRGGDNLLDVVRWVKDFRGKIPGKGRPYFAHRLLTDEGKEKFSAHWPMEITFNYLGQTQQLERDDALFQPVNGSAMDSISADTDVGPNVPRLSLFEVSAFVTSGSLKFTFSYNRHMKRQSSIRLWASECQAMIRAAVERLAQSKPEPTISDFPLLPLTYNGMAKLDEKLPQIGASSLKEIEDAYPCSPVQQGILFTQIKNPEYYAYSVNFEPRPTRLGHTVDINRLASAWKAVVQRHSTLRTVFVDNIFQEGQMYQVVLKEVTAKVTCLDCDESEMAANVAKQSSIILPENQPPHRLTMSKLSDGRVICVLEMSHAIADGTSMPILFRDLAYAYEGRLSTKGKLPLYSNYIAHMQRTSHDVDIKYWTKYLADIDPCYFPTLNDGVEEPKELLALDQRISCAAELQSFCSKNGVTLSNVLQLAWALVLQAYTGSDDVCFGYLTAGRDIPVDGIDDAIGVFINMLTCRVQLTPNLPLRQVLKTIQTDLLEGMGHQHVSLADVQHELQNFGAPLFNTAYSFQKRSVSKEMRTGPLSFKVTDAKDPSEYDITVNVEVWDSSAELQLCYWTDKLSTSQAKNIATTFDQVLLSILKIHDEGQAVKDINLLSDHCRDQVTKWNYEEPEAIEKCVHEVFEENVRKQPVTTPAVSGWDANFTYTELDTLASRLATHLVVTHGVKPEMYVPLCFEKSAWTVVAMMAVLKAGAAFVPLDSNHPADRIKYLVSSVDAKVVLCSAQFEKKMTASGARTLVVDKKTMKELSKKALKAPAAAVTPQNPAYIIFTSGTTGLPKGTIIEHGAFSTGGIAHARAIKMRSDSRVLQFASHTFDASIMEILSTLLVGGCICIPSEQDRMNDLTAVINSMKITWTLLTPSVANVLKPGSVPGLKVLVTGGEAMSPGHITKWADQACLVNAYGPSETSVIANTSTKVDENGTIINSEPACIGHAVGSRAWIVDPHNHDRLMPVGSIGELVVEGRIVARGYLKNEEKTKEAFIGTPKWRHDGLQLAGARNDRMYKTGDLVRYNVDGSLNYLGRKDTQVKLNGQRIELGEIEHHVKVNLPEEAQSTVDLVVPESATKAKALAVFFSAGITPTNNDEPEEEATEADAGIDEILLPMSSNIRSIGEALKAALESSLPAYMVPSIYVPITKMPWTTAGKLDKRRLREMVQKMPIHDVAIYKLASATKRRAPTTEMEKKLQRAWEAVLKLPTDSVGKDDSFFKIGGDSISAMQLVAAARLEKVSLTVLNVFKHSKLSEMAKFCNLLEESKQVTAKPFSMLKGAASASTILEEVAEHCRVGKQQVQDAYPCSSLQEGLITLSMRQAGAYVAKNVFEIPQNVDIDRFKAAWQKSLEEIDILRSRIVHAKSTKFYQVVLDAQPIPWKTMDDLQVAIDEAPKLPEYNGAPLTDYAIVENGSSGSRYFVWTIHHALYDAWSMPAMLDRVQANYSQEDSKADPKSPYVDFIKYLSQVNPEASDKYWMSRFEGASPSHFPPVLSTSSDNTTTSATLAHTTRFSRDKIAMEITMPTIIRAAWAMVIASYTSSDDVIFGETLSGRDIPVEGIMDILGPTLTTVPTRIDIDRDMSIMKFLKKLHEQAADVIPYQHAGLQNIKRLGPNISVACDFNNLLVIQTPQETNQDSLLKSVDGAAEENFFTYPLVLECTVGREKLDIIAHHDQNIISSWRTKRILGQFDSVIQQLVASSRSQTLKISEIEMCSTEDVKLIHDWNRQKLGLVDTTIHDLFLHQASIRPDATAISSWDGEFTYQQVKEWATQFAQYMVAMGVESEMLVPVCMDRSAWTTMAMLGVLMAGGGLVPLDPAHPPSRHADIVQDTKATIFLCSPKYEERYSGMVSRLIPVDQSTFQHLPNSNIRGTELPRIPTNSVGFVIYTSGSTGKPKGVLIEHRTFCTSSAAFMRRMFMKQTSRVFHFTSYAFDIGMGEVWSALNIGACLCIPSEEMKMGDLIGSLNTLKATWAFLTPSVVNVLDPKAFKSLEVLACGGEALTAETVKVWADNIILVNGYGPAECTVFAVANAHVSEEKDPTNIGRSMDGGNTWIVDPRDHNYLSPVGCVGELCIEGPIVARGYLNNPTKTAESFVENPLWARNLPPGRNEGIRMYKTGDLVKYHHDGSLIFMGRKDHQVKLHGQRMELGEVEHNLESDERVRHALVTLPKSGMCKQRLVAVLSLAQLAHAELGIASNSCVPVDSRLKKTASAQVAAIQDALSEILPPYMVPSTWLIVEAIPLLVSGKLDRTRIQNWVQDIDAETYKQAVSVTEEDEAKTPETATGKLLRRIWASVLNVPVEKTATNQTFLSLGGDSITAMQVMAQCREEQISLSLQEILRAKSISQLAQSIDSKKKSVVKKEVVDHRERVDAEFELSPIQQLFFDLRGQQQSEDRFNQSFLLRISKRTEAQDIDRAIQAIVNKHSMLRARFTKRESGTWQQRIIKDAKASYLFQKNKVNHESDMTPVIASSQGGLNIQNGPLFAANLFELRNGTQILSLIAHHLVMDMVSWLNILQDLETCLTSGSLKDDQPFSFQAWCAAQAQYANAVENRNDAVLPFDIEPADMGFWDMESRSNNYGDTKLESFVITDKAIVASALGNAHTKLKTEPVDLFLSAVAHAFTRVFGERNAPTIFNEGHGREPWDSSIDLSRTVGWFTSLCPVYVPVQKGANDVIDTLRKVKDTRRRIPGNGRPYFAHRYLTEEGRAQCFDHMPMEVCFNYLGRMQQVGRGDSLLEAFDYEKSEEQNKAIADVGPNTPRLALFEVTAAISKEGIQVSFIYNRYMQHQDRIHQWLNQSRSVIEETVKRLNSATPAPTLSDLPLLPISYAELDKIAQKALPSVGVSSLEHVEDIYPVSPMQTGILLSQLKDAGKYLFHTILEVIPMSPGDQIDAQRLAAACQQVVERHAALRTVFINSVYRGGTFDQVVLRVEDTRTEIIRCREAAVVARLDNYSLQATNKKKGPQLPYQFTVCETTEGKVFLKLEMNHAITDGASSSLLVRDISRAYHGRLPEGEAPTYRNYIDYIGNQQMDSSIKFWKSYLRAAKPSEFPSLTSEQTYKRLGSVPLKFKRYAELQALCAQAEVTFSNVMLAAWALMLRSYLGSDDVCFGYLASGRDAPVEGIEDTIGAFINMLVFRFRFTPTMSLETLFQDAQDDYLQSLPHQHCSLAKVQHELGGSNKSLFNTAMSIQSSAASGGKEEEGITFEPIVAHDPSEYAITLNINTARNDEGVVFRYWTDTLTDIQAEALAEDFADLLGEFIDKPYQPLSELSLFEELSKPEPEVSKNIVTMDPNVLQNIISQATTETIKQLLNEGLLQRPNQNQQTHTSDVASYHGGYQKAALATGALYKDDQSLKAKPIRPTFSRMVTTETQGMLRLTEQKLSALWREVLGLGEYEIDGADSFFELGGDSIVAMTMVGMARDEDLSLTVADVFRHPTFSEMLHAIDPPPRIEINDTASEEGTVYSDDGREAIQEEVYEPFSLLDIPDVDKFVQDYVCPNVHVFRGGIIDVLPVTDFQALAITGSMLDSRWMLNYFFLDGNGSLDLRLLKQSAFKIVQAFEVLRTVFIPHNKSYLQVVLRQLQPEFLVYDNVEDVEEFSVAFERKSRQQAPNFGESYVQFVVIQHKHSDRHRIFLRLSHAQYDGVCFPAILEALKAGYAGQPIPPTPSFSTYVRKSIGYIKPEHYTYWQNLLRGSSMTNVVHRERPSYNRSEGATKVLRRAIPIRSLASINITPATVVKAAWSLVLAQVTAKSDIVFGHIISGRNAAVQGIESVVGPCLNIVPVRVKYHSSWKVSDLLRFVQDQQVDNMPYESLGFREIIRKCTEWDDWTNFSTVLQHQSMARSTELVIADNSYKVGNMASQEDFADFSIVSSPKDADNIEVCLIYAPNGAITDPFAEQVFNNFCKAITAFSAEPHAALPSPSDLALMRRQTLEDTISPVPAASPEAVIRGLSKKDLYMLTDSLGRAWNQILRDEHDKPVPTPLDSSFFKLGGDIIGLAHVATFLAREGYKVRLEDLIDNPVMADQLALLSLQRNQERWQQNHAAIEQKPQVKEVVPEKKTTLWKKSSKMFGKMMGRKKQEA